MTKGRLFLIGAEVTAVVLFISSVSGGGEPHWSSWLVPLVLIGLLVVNSVWFSRLVSWLIFAGGFFALVIVLSAFTLRFRLEAGFEAAPFYRAMIMYAAFVYASLAQLKLRRI